MKPYRLFLLRKRYQHPQQWSTIFVTSLINPTILLRYFLFVYVSHLFFYIHIFVCLLYFDVVVVRCSCCCCHWGVFITISKALYFYFTNYLFIRLSSMVGVYLRIHWSRVNVFYVYVVHYIVLQLANVVALLPRWKKQSMLVLFCDFCMRAWICACVCFFSSGMSAVPCYS